MRRASNLAALDPLHLSVLWQRLIAIADEAASTLLRTAFSTVVRDANDYICMLLDRDGQAVVENSISIPAFTGALPKTMRHILARFPAAAWEPGDVVITNDPWIGTGHLPDFTVVSPIFHRGKLIGFAGSVAHMADVGGALWSADTTELYEEGLRIPISKLYRAGRIDETLLGVLRANVRVPDVVLGDLHAEIAANRTMAHRLIELIEEEGLDDLAPVSRAIQERAEAAMRRAITALPDGIYVSSCEIDGFDAPLTLRLAATIKGSEIAFDYTGTSPQQSRAINCAPTNTFAMTAHPLKSLLDPDTPRNDGSYRPVQVSAPEGSLLNPRFPAPVNARHLTFLHFASLVFQALADVIPDKVTAESGAPFIQVVFAGRNQHGEPFVYVPCDSPGMGARASKDGLSATPYPNNTGGAPIEVVEASSALMFWEKSLVPDSGGPGKTRGGLGVQLVAEILGSEPVKISVLGDRTRFPARGLRGGRNGLNSAILLNGVAIPNKGRRVLQPGDRLLFRMAGGGGCGDPRERARTMVAHDLAEGYISAEGARGYE